MNLAYLHRLSALVNGKWTALSIDFPSGIQKRGDLDTAGLSLLERPEIPYKRRIYLPDVGDH